MGASAQYKQLLEVIIRISQTTFALLVNLVCQHHPEEPGGVVYEKIENHWQQVQQYFLSATKLFSLSHTDGQRNL